MKHHVENLEEAIHLFEQELPDPFVSPVSTIKECFFIENTKVFFEAQKTKGPKGIRWSVVYAPEKKQHD